MKVLQRLGDNMILGSQLRDQVNSIPVQGNHYDHMNILAI